MNYVVITCLLALTASTKAGDLGVSSLVYAPRHSSADYYAYPSYAFEYTVKDPYTGDDKAQWERRDGDTVKGSYSLVEPGGSIRVVEYQADDNSGFNAVVRRIGPKLHPATITAAPIYKAPVPVLSARPVAPITAGPVANLGGLTSAPLITGSVLGGVVSSSNLLKLSQASLVNPTILPAPVLSSPIFKSAPILTAPAPILSIPTPVLPTPIIKSAPVLTAPASLLSNPYIKSASILSAPLSGSILSAPLPLLKGPLGLPLDTLGNSLIRSPLTTSLALDSLDANLLSRGPLLSTYNTL